MSQATQRGFDAAKDDGSGVFEIAPNQIGINDRSPIRTAGVEPARGMVVVFAGLAERGFVGNEAVYQAG